MPISVITPAYNAGRYIERAVASVLDQSEVAEVILIEDGSSDDTLAKCKALASADARVRLFQHPGGANRGAGATRNLGLQQVTQDLVAFLDADDYYLPGRFAVAGERLRDPAVDGVYEAIGVAYESDADRDKFLATRSQSLNPAGLTTIAAGFTPENLCMGLLVGGAGFCSLDGLTIRRNLLHRSGLFNEILRLHQDTHLLIRLAYCGRLVPGSLDQPVTMRWVHASNRITSATRAVSLPLQEILWHDLLAWGLRARMPTPLLMAIVKRAYRETRSLSWDSVRGIRLLRKLSWYLHELLMHPVLTVRWSLRGLMHLAGPA